MIIPKFAMMIRLEKFILALTFILSAHFSFSQEKKDVEIDSLISKSERLLKKNADSSLKYAFKAAELSQKKNDTEYIAKSFLAIGNVFDATESLDNEIAYCKKAEEVSKNISDEKLKTQIILNLGDALYSKGNYDEAFLNYRKAQIMGKKLNDADLLYRIYSGVGHIYAYEGNRNADSAMYYFNKEIAIALEKKDTVKIADSYRDINEVYCLKHEWDEALNCLNKALALNLKINNIEELAGTYKNIGDVYYYTKQNKKSIEYYQKAYDIHKNENLVSGIAISACDLAYMYAMDGRKDLLDKYGKESYDYAQKTKSWDVIKYSVLWLGKAYEKTGNDKKALFFTKQLLSINDSIINRSRIEKNSREIVQGGFEEKIRNIKSEEEKQKAVDEAKEKYQSFIRNILIAGMLISCVLLFITYRNFVAKKKANVIISKQKEEVETQKQLIEVKNKEITDSINYAKIIQQSILPDAKDIMKVFPQSFGLYKPKSVVSGDVYWFAQKNNSTMIAAVDCTGHGVPGALMSMIAVEKLNEAIAINLTRPSAILSHLNSGVKNTLRQKESGSGSQDGMDIALCCFDLEKNILRFAGAQRPLWLIRNNELMEFKQTKVSIGGFTPDNQEFISHEIKISQGDSIYIFSDGFADQFGGDKGKKMMTKHLKELLLSIQQVPFLEQEKFLADKLAKWQGEYEQVDDILVIGIKI